MLIKGKRYFVLGEGTTQELDDTEKKSDAKYSTNFKTSWRKFC